MRRLPIIKDLSYGSIRKQLNPIERNISMYSYRRPPPASMSQAATNRSQDVPIVSSSIEPAKEYFIKVPSLIKE